MRREREFVDAASAAPSPLTPLVSLEESVELTEEPRFTEEELLGEWAATVLVKLV